MTNSNPYDLVNPQLSATNSFTVVVREVNVAPVLPVIADQTVNELTLLTVTNTATEREHPLHDLGYGLVNPPAGVASSANGIITWTPGQNQSPSTNTITTVVTNSNPYDLVNPHLTRDQQLHGGRAGSERGAGAAGDCRPRRSTN